VRAGQLEENTNKTQPILRNVTEPRKNVYAKLKTIYIGRHPYVLRQVDIDIQVIELIAFHGES